MTAQICEFCKHENEDCYCSPNSTCDKFKQKDFTMREPTLEERESIEEGIKKISIPTGINFWDYCNPDNIKVASVYNPKIINGSTLSIGNEIYKTQVKTDQHFNWFQKLMWKWCFGVKVEDYSEE